MPTTVDLGLVKGPKGDPGDLGPGVITREMIQDGAITTEKIKDGAITTEKLADKSVTTEKLADNSVTSEKIKDGEVKTQDIADGAVTKDKLSGDLLKVLDSGRAKDKTSIAGKYIYYISEAKHYGYLIAMNDNLIGNNYTANAKTYTLTNNGFQVMNYDSSSNYGYYISILKNDNYGYCSSTASEGATTSKLFRLTSSEVRTEITMPTNNVVTSLYQDNCIWYISNYINYNDKTESNLANIKVVRYNTNTGIFTQYKFPCPEQSRNLHDILYVRYPESDTPEIYFSVRQDSNYNGIHSYVYRLSDNQTVRLSNIDSCVQGVQVFDKHYLFRIIDTKNMESEYRELDTSTGYLLDEYYINNTYEINSSVHHVSSALVRMNIVEDNGIYVSGGYFYPIDGTILSSGLISIALYVRQFFSNLDGSIIWIYSGTDMNSLTFMRK